MITRDCTTGNQKRSLLLRRGPDMGTQHRTRRCKVESSSSPASAEVFRCECPYSHPFSHSKGLPHYTSPSLPKQHTPTHALAVSMCVCADITLTHTPSYCTLTNSSLSQHAPTLSFLAKKNESQDAGEAERSESQHLRPKQRV